MGLFENESIHTTNYKSCLAGGKEIIIIKSQGGSNRKPITGLKRKRIRAENVKNKKAVSDLKRERVQAKNESGNKAVLEACGKLASQVSAFNAQLNGIRLVMTKILKRLPE